MKSKSSGWSRSGACDMGICWFFAGSDGLPSITGDITINGNGAIIERSSAGGKSDGTQTRA